MLPPQGCLEWQEGPLERLNLQGPIPDRLLVRRIYADCLVHNLGLFSQEKAEVEMTLSQSLGPLLGKEVSS